MFILLVIHVLMLLIMVVSMEMTLLTGRFINDKHDMIFSKVIPLLMMLVFVALSVLLLSYTTVNNLFGTSLVMIVITTGLFIFALHPKFESKVLTKVLDSIVKSCNGVG